MAENKEEKIVLEREYLVPLRRKWRNTPDYRRVPRAIRALRRFIAKHMKVEERDANKVKIDRLLNEELWFRGIRKPPAKIKVKAKKYENGIVLVELSELPEMLKWKAEKEKRKKEARKAEKIEKKPEEKEEKKAEAEKKPEEKTEKPEETMKEKEKSTIEAGLKLAEKAHKQTKHEVAEKHGIKKPLRRMALKK